MVVIRLARGGRKGSPVYKIMVSDKDAKLTGRFLEKLGIYRPGIKSDELSINTERYDHWVKLGAVTSPRLHKIVHDHRKQLPATAAAATTPVAAPKAPVSTAKKAAASAKVSAK